MNGRYGYLHAWDHTDALRALQDYMHGRITWQDLADRVEASERPVAMVDGVQVLNAGGAVSWRA